MGASPPYPLLWDPQNGRSDLGITPPPRTPQGGFQSNTPKEVSTPHSQGGVAPFNPQLLFSWMKKVTKKITAYKKLAKNSLCCCCALQLASL